MAELIVDRRTALVRSMISSAGPARSDSRYLLMAEILASLCGRGVRHVLVGRALTLPPGLVYFQQRLGFDAVNLRLVDLRADES